MNGVTNHLRSPNTVLTNSTTTTINHRNKKRNGIGKTVDGATIIWKKDQFPTDKMTRKSATSSARINAKNNGSGGGFLEKACFMKWRMKDLLDLVKYHPIPCLFAVSVLFFMGVEYTLRMIPSIEPPFDLGFVVTVPIHRLLASRPNLNNFLAGLNTVFVAMQTGYILWTWLIEGRPRATIATLYMFTCRGILGYATQLPLPEDFLGSGVDFPVGNVSFFLFYSGHVAASVIASIDMKLMKRYEMALIFDVLNILQAVRLLSTRGHYTIDLAVGVGAGILFDYLATNYLLSKNKSVSTVINSNDCEDFSTFLN